MFASPAARETGLGGEDEISRRVEHELVVTTIPDVSVDMTPATKGTLKRPHLIPRHLCALWSVPAVQCSDQEERQIVSAVSGRYTRPSLGIVAGLHAAPPLNGLAKRVPRSRGFKGSCRADKRHVAEKHAVECLRCGGFRTVQRERTERLDPGECPDCGYVGWALFTELTEATRRILREHPPERRGRSGARLRAV